MKNKAILCVDDEPIILESLKAELGESFGSTFLIEIAESGEEALEVIDFLAEKQIETLIVITDWLMPDMKGDELLAKIHAKFPNMGKIMLSGQADQKAITRVQTEVRAAFLSKPWDRKKLNDLIVTCLG